MSKMARKVHRQARQEVAQQRRRRQRRNRILTAFAAVFLVVGVVAVLVLVKVSGRATPGTVPDAKTVAVPVPGAVTAVPPVVLDSVATGKVDSLPRRLDGQPALTANGKPLVLYVGAEYCPFCAAQRWAMVVALSRFGTFTGLTVSHSATDDVYPGTVTVSFHGATYTSQYLEFQGVETHTNVRSGNTYTTLDQLTDPQQQVMRVYNAPPFVAAESAGSIPFIDFGNRYLLAGASFSPQLLSGKSADQIAAALSDPHSDIAVAVDGTANAFTAVICQLTGNQPSQVCGTTAANAYQGRLR